MAVSAVIPALNEEKSIYETITALRQLREISEIVVVDDGSADNTALVAKEAGADVVVVLKQNHGKGEALTRGVSEAKGEIICLVDADLGSTAAAFESLIAPVLANEADMTVAVWPKSKKKAGFGLVKRLAAGGIKYLTGYAPLAPLSGQRVLRRKLFELCKCKKGFGIEVSLTVECLRLGFCLKEIPVSMHHRETGRDLAGFRHRGKQFVQVLSTLWQTWRGRVKT